MARLGRRVVGVEAVKGVLGSLVRPYAVVRGQVGDCRRGLRNLPIRSYTDIP